jgi:PAS domain S-box-containing protein
MFSPKQKLNLTEEQVHSFIDETAAGIFITDGTGLILSASPALSRTLGYNTDEFRQINIREITLDGNQGEFIISELPQNSAGERCFLHKDGGKVHLRCSITVLTGPDGTPDKMIAVCDTQGEQRKLQEQATQAQKMEALGRVAGGVAHDFNNLLMIINSYGSLLVSEFGVDSPMGRKAVAITEASSRATELTRHLLAFSRKQVLRTCVTSLDDIVRTSEKLLRRLIREDIEIAVELESGGVLIDVDPGQLDRVLMNLVVNASDAMPKGGQLTIRTERAFINDGDKEFAFASLSIKDTGIGMDAATQSRIFEPFFTSKKEAGTGLGLSTVYGVVEQSGGTIEVESSPGLGTTFRILLPSVEGSQKVAQDFDEIMVQQPSKPLRATVLLAEDEDLLRRCLTNTLTAMGCYVLQAKNGAEALELARRQLLLIDVLITDMVMPKLGGYDLVMALREMRPTLPVIIMSGYPDKSPPGEEMNLSGMQFLQKPFDPRILQEEIRRMVSQPHGSGTSTSVLMPRPPETRFVTHPVMGTRATDN